MAKRKSLYGPALRLCVAAAILFAVSCGESAQKKISIHYTEPIFDSAMRLGISGFKSSAFALVSRMYAGMPFCSVADQYRLYSFKFDFYHSYYSDEKNLDSAFVYTDSMLFIIENNGMASQMSKQYALAYSDRAEILMEEKKYEEAIKAVSVSGLLAENNGDSCSLAEYNSTIALAMYRQNRFLDAAHYFQKAIIEIGNCEETAVKYHRIQGWLDNLALSYTRANMPDSALAYYDKAEDYIEQKKALYSFEPSFPKIAKGVVWGQKAEAFIEKKQYQAAESLYKNAIRINMQKGYDNQFATEMKIRLGLLYLLIGKPDSIPPLIAGVHKAIEEWQFNSEDLQRNLLKLMVDYYTAKGDVPNTNTYLHKYLQYNDSTAAASTNLYETNSGEILKHLQLEQQTTLAEKDDVLRRSYLIAVICFVVLLAIALVVVRRNWLQARERAIRLEKIHEQIRQAGTRLEKTLDELNERSNEKDKIVRMVAHDLRTPVSIVNLLTHTVDKKNEEKEKGMLRTIEMACTEALELINDILASSRPREKV